VSARRGQRGLRARARRVADNQRVPIAHHLRIGTVALAEVALAEALLTNLDTVRARRHDHARPWRYLNIAFRPSGEVTALVASVSA
jgi:hypothetical protein